MAAKTKSKPATTSARKTTRDYVVVQMVGDATLKVIDPQRPAKNQEDAINSVVANIPPEKRTGVFGAFLFSSYREQELSTEQHWRTNAVNRSPSFVTSPPPAGSFGVLA